MISRWLWGQSRQVTAAALLAVLVLLLGESTLGGSCWDPDYTRAAAAVSAPQTILHRTGPLYAPENTVAGITEAGRRGVATVELDWRYTKSTAPDNGNWPVLMHDATVDRTTNGTGAVSSIWLADLRKLSAADYAPWNSNTAYKGFKADGTPVTPVAEAGAVFKAAKAANVTVLSHMVVAPNRQQFDRLVTYMNASAWAGRTIFMGSAYAVSQMHSWYPSYTYVVIDWPPTGYQMTPQRVKEVGASGYALQSDLVYNAQTLNLYSSQGLKTYAWTTNEAGDDVPGEWQRLADLGVDYLITNKEPDARTLLAPAPTVAPSPSSMSPTPTPSASVSIPPIGQPGYAPAFS